jgi:hypothetical protein
MSLTTIQQQRVIAHLNSRIRSGCPLCGSRNLTVDADLQYLGVLDAEYKQPVEGKVYPVVSVTCDNCHYVVHLSAMKLGLL